MAADYPIPGSCIEQLLERWWLPYIKGLEEKLKNERAALDETPYLEALIALTVCLKRKRVRSSHAVSPIITARSSVPLIDPTAPSPVALLSVAAAETMQLE